MKFFRTALFLLLVSISKTLFAQGTDCYIINNTFKSGEKVYYRAVYNWGFIWINAADVIFTVKDTIYAGENCYYLKSEGWSLKQYDWFYKVRDKFESIVNKDSLKPHWFRRDTYEGGYVAYNNYTFDYNSNNLKINSYTSERKSKLEQFPLKPCTFDVLSAIYYCRNIDFNSLVIDQKVPLTMAVDNEIYDLYIRFLGKEKIIIHKGKTYNTFKFSAMLVKGTIFKGGEDLVVWVTDDNYHIPVMVEAKILIGSVKALLVGVEGI
ncbi:MAG: DUF3108 domain-containing protein [Bacteroidales bacterium]|nr:DUF3108 domain-containing protein [Bacteroidales bacterium]